MSAPSPTDRDPHVEIELLLPWYVTGRLEPVEHQAVDLHLAQCDTCRALLAEECALREAVIAIPSPRPAGAEGAPGPTASVKTRPRDRTGGRWARIRQGFGRPRKPGWFLAAQAATIAVAVGVVQWNAPSPTLQPAAYRTLSAAPTTAGAAVMGNIVVMFEPAATEAQLRRTLQGVNASIVEGPTPANAYVLHVDDAHRDAAIERLRGEDTIILAEAIDGNTTQ